ncbi:MULTISPECIES: DUF1192 domain-containing protein [Rhizobium/Agrobacterium group]|jgi:uncharacterized small protein (DUF1192 family)|uniref:DUF1192 domain-containing protein n=1 Tax=Rhizobium/Agrobacterium group TaxID=227290 RepID=UPI0015736D20|nr:MULTISPECIES: DUF1192 domain-containing protein [Rhizobium/Agrobacterium group]MBD8662224.1 DUF1192 domain-containing protein [Rhizobium sp. CFBP 8752]NSY17164.1 DUF1192 domain-containing protein [Neorhizobium sp. AL 9.2.2]
MSFLDDDRPKKPAAHEIGADLSLLSADELQMRITILQEEIARLEAEKARKAEGRKAADSFFRT